MSKEQKTQVYFPPSVLIGELIIFKGYKWRVQAFSPNGGQVDLTDETGKSGTGHFNDAVLVIECVGKTSGHIKREQAAAKRPATIQRQGFRQVPLVAEEKRIVEPATKLIVTPEEAARELGG